MGFAGADWENLSPVEDHAPNSMGDTIYYACKIVDGEKGQEDGTSIHSLARVLKTMGRTSAYAWLTSIPDVKAWVRTKGPVPIGIDWFEDMFSPDSNGLVHPTGALAGGHAIDIVGDWPDVGKNGAALVLNSWGPNWGLDGYFLIEWSELAPLLSADSGGEALATLENPLS